MVGEQHVPAEGGDHLGLANSVPATCFPPAAGLASAWDVDLLGRISALRFLAAGQINGFNDAVLKAWQEAGTAKSLIALSLDACDNITDEAVAKFLPALRQAATVIERGVSNPL